MRLENNQEDMDFNSQKGREGKGVEFQRPSTWPRLWARSLFWCIVPGKRDERRKKA